KDSHRTRAERGSDTLRTCLGPAPDPLGTPKDTVPPRNFTNHNTHNTLTRTPLCRASQAPPTPNPPVSAPSPSPPPRPAPRPPAQPGGHKRLDKRGALE